MGFTKRTSDSNKTTGNTILIALIFCFALILRVFLLGKFPPSLNRDEAALGWNAYSILKTGKDEWGKFLPLSFKSFGDYKMPLYIYLCVPSIAIFGLNEFAVRFPSALFGSLTVLLVYFLVKKLFSRKISSLQDQKYLTILERLNQDESGRLHLPIIVMLLLAINPWHLHYSRVAFEANVCLFLVVAGITFFLYAFKKPWLFSLSTLFFVFSLYAYSSVFVFLPPLFLITLFLYRNEFKLKENILPLMLAAIIFILGSTQAAFSVNEVSLAKKAITVFSDPGLIDNFNHQRTALFLESPILARVWLNKPFYFLRIVLRNYLTTFSPNFLFLTGGRHPWHIIPGFGNFYKIDAVFFVLGILSWFKLRGKGKWLLAVWFFLAPLASAITIDAPHSTRSLPLVVPMIILISLGINQVTVWLKTRKKKLIFYSLLCTLYSVLFCYWLYAYYYEYPRKLPIFLMSGLKEALLFTYTKDSQKKIIMDEAPASPYIYALFYLKINPEEFWQTVKHYGPGVDGIDNVYSFGRFQFFYQLPEERQKAFYILRTDNLRRDETKINKKFFDPSGKTTFVVQDE